MAPATWAVSALPAVTLPLALSSVVAVSVASVPAVICARLVNVPVVRLTAPLAPMTPPCAPSDVVPPALVMEVLALTDKPSVFNETRRPAVLSTEAALTVSAPPACTVPCALFSAPVARRLVAPWLTIWPPALETLPAVMPVAPLLDKWPRSLMKAPAAVVLTAPPAWTVAPVRSALPVDVSARLALAVVWLLARLTPAPWKLALPPATFLPVADNAPVVVMLRSAA